MPIGGAGWELLVERQVVHRHDVRARTAGAYRVFRDGRPTDIAGMMCESLGPGDNAVPDTGLRLAPGTYPLSTHFGQRYRTIGYAVAEIAGIEPMPGFLLTGTGNRTAIVLHPAHPPTLYLSSVGCLNPTRPLPASAEIDFFESRARVIALIDSLRAFAPQAFIPAENTPIPGASVVIEGEPD
jgi:hypothetical protein